MKEEGEEEGPGEKEEREKEKKRQVVTCKTRLVDELVTYHFAWVCR